MGVFTQYAWFCLFLFLFGFSACDFICMFFNLFTGIQIPIWSTATVYLFLFFSHSDLISVLLTFAMKSANVAAPNVSQAFVYFGCFPLSRVSQCRKGCQYHNTIKVRWHIRCDRQHCTHTKIKLFVGNFHGECAFDWSGQTEGPHIPVGIWVVK